MSDTDNDIDLARSRLWANPAIGMIGRKSVFTGRIKPIILSKGGFVLKGEPGVGLSALLEACCDVAKNQGTVALISGKDPLSKSMKTICDQWEIEVETEKKVPTVQDMERAIMRTSGCFLLIDDMNRMTPRALDFVKALSQYHRISGSVRIGKSMKEELRQLLWSMEEIRIVRLDSKHSVILAEKMCQHFGTAVSFRDVANNSMGLPGRIYASAKSGKIIRNEIRMASEEINLAPVLMVCLCCLIIFRYFGRAVDATDLVLFGGVGIIFLMLGRGIVTKGKEK